MLKLTKTASVACLVGWAAGAAAGEEPASQYSPLKDIRPDNVQQLKAAWTYRTGEPLVALPGGGRPPAFEATPVYAFGLLYIGTPYGKVIALEPETGKATSRPVPSCGRPPFRPARGRYP